MSDKTGIEWRAEYQHPRRVLGYPVMVAKDFGSEGDDSCYAAWPRDSRGWLKGAITQGATPDIAIDRLAEVLPELLVIHEAYPPPIEPAEAFGFQCHDVVWHAATQEPRA